MRSVPFQLKRYFNILRDSVVYTEVEIANITTPIAGTGDYTICPPFIFCSRTVMLLIIQKIMWELAYNFVFMAEHQAIRQQWGAACHLRLVP